MERGQVGFLSSRSLHTHVRTVSLQTRLKLMKHSLAGKKVRMLWEGAGRKTWPVGDVGEKTTLRRWSWF
jgi:hypothetical protein